MAKSVPKCEPAELTIGSSWAWDVTYADFPADNSWQLNYYLRGHKDVVLAWGTHVSAGTGAEFEVRVTPAQQTTLGLTTQPGKYQLVGRVSKSGDTWDGEIVYTAHLLVLANPTTAVNAKTFNRQMLEAIDAALVAGVSSSAEAKRLTVNGRSIEYRDLAELEGRRSHYAYLVALEENPNAEIVDEVYAARS